MIEQSSRLVGVRHEEEHVVRQDISREVGAGKFLKKIAGVMI